MARTGERSHWAGGRKFFYPDTKRTKWVIERMRFGKRRAVALDVRSEADALAELALYERDPESYLTRSKQAVQVAERKREEVLPFTEELCTPFYAHLRGRDRTEHYIRDIERYLGEWQSALDGCNLKKTTITTLRVQLGKWETAERKRIIALKSFCTYLRDRRGLLASAEDASLSLKVPPARPERGVRKKGYAIEHVQKVYAKVALQEVRDVITLHAKCGMHGTEIERLAKGEGQIRALEGHGEIAGTITFVHKSGEPHINSIDAQTLAAAQRLQARGYAPADTWVRKNIKRAAKKAGVDSLRPGELRHSFVAWAHIAGREVRPATGGLPLATIASFIGHRSPVTTRRFYNVADVPPMVVVPVVLAHPDDPAPAPVGGTQPRLRAVS